MSISPQDTIFYLKAVNRIRDENVRYPHIDGARPIYETIECDERHPASRVLRFIFNRVFLAQTLDLAQSIADGTFGPKFDAITTEGDHVSLANSPSWSPLVMSIDVIQIKGHL